MKQVPVTDAIRQKLTAAAGDGVNPDNLAVYEATALNTNPVRKRHPLYHGAIHTRQFLNEMSDYLSKESLPLYTQHDKDPLNVGRVFHGQVVDDPVTSAPQLRTLFWVDKTHPDLVQKLDNGTVDQVSVSILPKDAICNQCGFDFMGKDATFDNLWGGTCPDGHVMGEGGAHTLSNHLDAWNEMSLVARGGIPGARIHAPADSRLALSANTTTSFLTLNLSSEDLEKPTMDMTKLVADLTDEKAKGLQLTAQVTAKDAQITELTAKVAEAPAKDAKIVELTAESTALTARAEKAEAAVKDVAKHLLALAGDATTQLSEKFEEVVALITEKTKVMKLSFKPADTKAAESNDTKPQPKASSAFKAPR